VRLRTENVFGTEGCSRMKGPTGQRSVTSGRLDMMDAPDKTLGVVDFSGKHSITWTCVIILMRVKF